MRRNPNRRAFLRRASLATAGLLFPATAVRTEPARVNTIPFGFSLYAMKTLSLDAGLQACAKIGYDAVELPLMPDWPAEPKRLTKDDRRKLRERLAELKLALPALMENLPPNADDLIHRKQTERLKAAELGNELVPDAPAGRDGAGRQGRAVGRPEGAVRPSRRRLGEGCGAGKDGAGGQTAPLRSDEHS
jgi:sugar phosphate isomerase/epimerase